MYWESFFFAFSSVSRYQEAVAAAAVEKLTIPVPEGVEKPVSLKIDKLVQEITALNLLEVAELSDVLKKRLNLPDAPVMPIGGQFMAAPKAEVKFEYHYLLIICFDFVIKNEYISLQSYIKLNL